MFTGASQAAKTRQREQQPPLSIGTRFQHPVRHFERHEKVTGTVPPHGRLQWGERIFRNPTMVHGILKKLLAVPDSFSNRIGAQPPVFSVPA